MSLPMSDFMCNITRMLCEKMPETFHMSEANEDYPSQLVARFSDEETPNCMTFINPESLDHIALLSKLLNGATGVDYFGPRQSMLGSDVATYIGWYARNDEISASRCKYAWEWENDARLDALNYLVRMTLFGSLHELQDMD